MPVTTVHAHYRLGRRVKTHPRRTRGSAEPINFGVSSLLGLAAAAGCGTVLLLALVTTPWNAASTKDHTEPTSTQISGAPPPRPACDLWQTGCTANAARPGSDR